MTTIPQHRIISEREVLQRCEFNQGPRITKIQIVEVNGQRFQCDFWTYPNGLFARVDSKPLKEIAPTSPSFENSEIAFLMRD